MQKNTAPLILVVPSLASLGRECGAERSVPVPSLRSGREPGTGAGCPSGTAQRRIRPTSEHARGESHEQSIRQHWT